MKGATKPREAHRSERSGIGGAELIVDEPNLINKTAIIVVDTTASDATSTGQTKHVHKVVVYGIVFRAELGEEHARQICNAAILILQGTWLSRRVAP